MFFKRFGILQVLAIRLHHHAILVERFVERGNLALAVGIVQCGINATDR